MLPLRPFTALALLAAGTAVAAVLPPGVFTLEPADPTEVHEWMLDMVGEWEGSMKLTRPGMPQLEFDVTETFHPVGRLWITSDLVGDLMGQPYHGHCVLGYDPDEGALVGTGCDSMMTHLAAMSGGYDEDDRVIRMSWKAPVPGRKGLQAHRSVQTLRGDSLERKYFEGEGAEEVLVMTITTRRKID